MKDCRIISLGGDGFNNQECWFFFLSDDEGDTFYILDRQARLLCEECRVAYVWAESVLLAQTQIIH
jgi:hypothetical protein